MLDNPTQLGPTPDILRDEVVWRALADPTRRHILDLLRGQAMPTGELAARFEMSRFGVMKHLKVLAEARLVIVESRGRERWNSLNPVPIQSIYRRWMRPFAVEDADRALRLKHHVEKDHSMSESESFRVEDVVLELEIEAPVEKVWKGLVHDIGKWWHPEFYTSPNAKSFVVEEKLGGLMYEDWGDGNGELWGTIMGMKSQEYLRVVGDTTKDWGGPNRGILSWTLARTSAGTLLKFDHSIYGRVSETTRDSLLEGWKMLFNGCLKPYVETGAVPDASSMPAPECNR